MVELVGYAVIVRVRFGKDFAIRPAAIAADLARVNAIAEATRICLSALT